MSDNFDRFISVLPRHMGHRESFAIYEIGSYDGAHAIRFSEVFHRAPIFSLEPDPELYVDCANNVARYENIFLLPVAAGEQNGCASFHAALKKGATGSLYKPSGAYDGVQKLHSAEITVPVFRLDTLIQCLKFPPPTILWLDAQGAELSILKGLGRHLRDVEAIWTEVEYRQIYADQPLKNDVVKFLTDAGFTIAHDQPEVADWWGNMAFVRK